MNTPLIELKNLTKTFGGLVAVNDVSFAVPQGAIVGLIGPNGAGKTTVFNLITGNYTPDTGEVLFNKQDMVGLKPHKIVSSGIARTFQTIRLFKNMSALENVLAGCHCRMKAGPLACMIRPKAQRTEEKAAIERAMAELDFVGLLDEWDNLSSNLSYGKQRLLEIARALASDPQFIILDEPAGGMNDQETQALIDLIRAMRDRGITVLLIEHDMGLVMEVCEQLVVIEYGALIAEGTPEDVKNNPRVIEAYLGTDDDLF